MYLDNNNNFRTNNNDRKLLIGNEKSMHPSQSEIRFAIREVTIVTKTSTFERFAMHRQIQVLIDWILISVQKRLYRKNVQAKSISIEGDHVKAPRNSRG